MSGRRWSRGSAKPWSVCSKQFVGLEPVGRMGTPEEIAAAAVWLCSRAASFVTGHAMAVDGSFVAQ